LPPLQIAKDMARGESTFFLVEAAERRGINVRGGTTVLQLFTATNNNNMIG
jgi:hypothetical protein